MHRSLPLLIGLIAACLLAPGAQAQDDHSDQALTGTMLTVGSAATSGKIGTAGDRDWFRFGVTTGRTYVVETSDLAGGMDSVIYLFGPDGRRVGFDDDGASERLASRLEWKATASGTAYLAVLHYSSKGTGSYRVRAAGPATPPTPPAPAPEVGESGWTLGGTRVFDPKLTGAECSFRLSWSGSGTRVASMRITGSGGTVATLFSGATVSGGTTYRVAWNGKGTGGAFARPGTYTAVLEAAGAVVARRTLHLVRLGVTRADWTGSGRVPMLYHRSDPRSLRSYLAVDAIGPAWSLDTSSGDLDRADGSPLPGPAIWTDTVTPPRTGDGAVRTRGTSLPVAYAAGGERSVRLTLGARSGSATCGYPIADLPLRVVLDGRASGAISPGGTATIALDPLYGGVARRDATLGLRFEYREGGSWLPVSGSQAMAQRLYTVLRRPELAPPGTSSGAPYLPWVYAVDKVAGWSGGAAVTDQQVLDLATDRIYRSGLRYDREAGAPAYSAGSPAASTFDLAAYQLGYYGSVINCTDAANLVSVHARMVGVDAYNMYLGTNFPLLWIKGIGSSWTDRLFISGGHSFSFHMVATASRGALINDACLAVDGDSNPYSPPHVESLPMGMPFDTYHDRLTSGSFRGMALDRSRIR